jgi:hypothetical protein
VDDSAARVAQMTQLQFLQCKAFRGQDPSLSFSALQQWTALKGLTSLITWRQEMYSDELIRNCNGWPGAVVELRAMSEVSTRVRAKYHAVYAFAATSQL